MGNTLFLLFIIGGMFALERCITLQLCSHERSRNWLKHSILLHPNTLSLLRFPMGIISICIAAAGHWSFATLFYAFWMITDVTDGTIARSCDLGSSTGKWLDPLSDKFMYVPVLLYFCYAQNVSTHLSPLPVYLTILIDFIGQFSRLFVKKTAANIFGKTKTALITLLLTLLAIQEITHGFSSWMTENFILVFTWSCALLAFLSAYCKICPDQWYANSFTLANFICGVLAILCAFKGKIYLCFIMVFLGQFFDLFDGRLARKFGSTKGGPVFDDIADATSFGLGIGSLVFICLYKLESLISFWPALILTIFYVICLIYRLYRFLHPTEEQVPGIFQGLPAPAGALFSGAAVLASLEFPNHPWTAYIAAILVFLSSCLMVSKLRYCHFGQTILPNFPKPARLVALLIIILLCIFAFSHEIAKKSIFIWFNFAVGFLYLVFGLQRVNHLTPPKPETSAK